MIWLLIFLFIPHRTTGEKLNETLPRVKTQNLQCKRFSEMLAPPPINFTRELVPEGNRQYEVTYDGRTASLHEKADKEEYPLIIKGPGGKFWIKLGKYRQWVDLKFLEDESNLLLASLKKVMGFKPPGGPPDKGNGNGGGGEDNAGGDWSQPFLIGDVVISKLHPEFGAMKVLEVKRLEAFALGQFWWAVKTNYIVQGDQMIHEYFASSEDFILVARNQ